MNFYWLFFRPRPSPLSHSWYFYEMYFAVLRVFAFFLRKLFLFYHNDEHQKDAKCIEFLLEYEPCHFLPLFFDVNITSMHVVKNESDDCADYSEGYSS